MAAQGLRDTEDGVEKIANARVAAELRARGRMVHLFAAGSALLTVGLVLAALAL